MLLLVKRREFEGVLRLLWLLCNELLQQTDKLIMTLPEVRSAHGKIGRADTATDPAPFAEPLSTSDARRPPRP